MARQPFEGGKNTNPSGVKLSALENASALYQNRDNICNEALLPVQIILHRSVCSSINIVNGSP